MSGDSLGSCTPRLAVPPREYSVTAMNLCDGKRLLAACYAHGPQRYMSVSSVDKRRVTPTVIKLQEAACDTQKRGSPSLSNSN